MRFTAPLAGDKANTTVPLLLALPRTKLSAAGGAGGQLLAKDGEAGRAHVAAQPRGTGRAGLELSASRTHSAGNTLPQVLQRQAPRRGSSVELEAAAAGPLRSRLAPAPRKQPHPRSIWRLWQKQLARKSTCAVPGMRRNWRVAASTANTDCGRQGRVGHPRKAQVMAAPSSCQAGTGGGRRQQQYRQQWWYRQLTLRYCTSATGLLGFR